MMKRIIILLLLPVFAIAQTNFVKWSGTTDLAPTVQNSNVQSQNFSGSGLNGPNATWDGITATGWPNGNNINTSKYFQVTLTANINSQVALTNINFGYKGNCRNYEIRCSKDVNFSTYTLLANNTEANYYGSDIYNANVSGLNQVINGGETLYIRFYAYNGYNGGGEWRIRNDIQLQGTVLANPSMLNGTYLIGSAPGSNFQTITAAVSALNEVGVSGPVTFLLDNTVYNRALNEIFPLVINPYDGNTLHTVTFKPNAGKQVEIESTNISSIATPAVFKLNGVDNVIIDGSNNGSDSRDLTIYNNNPIGDAEKSVIWIASQNASNGANNNIIKNVTLKHLTRSGAVAAGVFSGGSGSAISIEKDVQAQAANSGNQVHNVLFTTVGQAIYINGNAALPSEKWQITNNVIGSTVSGLKPFLGIYINNVKDYEIIGNSIVGVLKNTSSYNPLHSGVIITGNSNGLIKSNTIRDIYQSVNWSNCAGILVESGNNIITNNMISNVRGIHADNGSSNMYVRGTGIYMKSGINNKIYFNTIHMNSVGGINFRSSAVFIEGGSGTDIRNNIFYNSQLLGKQYGIYVESTASAASFSSDYNNFAPVTLGTVYTGYINGNDIPTLAAWKAATSKDMNSVAVVPSFISFTDLHLDAENNTNVTMLDAKGIAIEGFNTDFDGDFRHIAVPDMGADEFGPKCVGGTTTWNGLFWSNGTPNSDKAVVFTGSYFSSGNIEACSVSVMNLAIVQISNGDNLIVTNEVSVALLGSLIINNKANLIQVNDVDNTGNITVKRNVSIRRLDYVYWSSPVEGQNLKAFSPMTVSPPVASSRFYELDEPSNTLVAIDPLSTNFVPAKGYCIRAPNDFTQGLQTFTGVFTGTANNGNITIPATVQSLGFNLIGNPYPSTIDARAFMSVNPGTLYFWTHTNLQNGGVNYATYNQTGGTASHAGGARPDGTIQAGQGFMIEKAVAATVQFTNDMRIMNNSANLYRTASSTEINRIWLNLTSADAALSQILVGYMTGATNGIDIGMDGASIDTASGLASLIGEDRFAIQARPVPFEPTDIVPLSFKAATAGNFTITIDEVDGLFADDQAIYLKDELTGVTHDLKVSPYTFASEAGSFNNRFSIVYQNTTLGTENPVLQPDNIVIFKKNGNLEINAGQREMAEVAVYDISGRLLISDKEINSSTATITMSGIATQVVIVQITGTDNTVVSKKVIY